MYDLFEESDLQQVACLLSNEQLSHFCQPLDKVNDGYATLDFVA